MAATDLPDLQDALVRRFRTRELLPPLDLIPAVLPVVQVDPISVQLSGAGESPAYRRGEHAAGQQVGIVAANATLLTTGPQQAGVYDAFVNFTYVLNVLTSTILTFQLVRRLIAADIIMFDYNVGFVTGNYSGEPLTLAVELQQQEELLLKVGPVATPANSQIREDIWLHRRS